MWAATCLGSAMFPLQSADKEESLACMYVINSSLVDETLDSFR